MDFRQKSLWRKFSDFFRFFSCNFLSKTNFSLHPICSQKPFFDVKNLSTLLLVENVCTDIKIKNLKKS